MLRGLKQTLCTPGPIQMFKYNFLRMLCSLSHLSNSWDSKVCSARSWMVPVSFRKGEGHRGRTFPSVSWGCRKCPGNKWAERCLTPTRLAHSHQKGMHVMLFHTNIPTESAFPTHCFQAEWNKHTVWPEIQLSPSASTSNFHRFIYTVD